MHWIRRRLFGISPAETSFSRRGFHGAPEARRTLERAGGAFVTGYNAALEADGPAGIMAQIGRMDRDLQGFAMEGSGMALALLDLLLPGRGRRWQAMESGPGRPHTYLLHVGAGWALARLHRRPERLMSRMDPLLGWLALDGCGFHYGYFAPERYLTGAARPAAFAGYAGRGFDQGLGRSLWFAHGADPAAVAGAIDRFDPLRRADLWSGVGLAAAYAGGVAPDGLALLRRLAGPHHPAMAQGVAFAAKARVRAGNETEATLAACRIICECGLAEAAAATELALADLVPDGDEPAFETWRRRIQRQFGGMAR